MKKELYWALFNMMSTLLKKSISVFLLLLLFSITCFSQNIYSKQNLEQASMEELNTYLKVAQKLKKTGTIMSVAGPAAFIAGYFVYADAVNEGEMYGSDVGGYLLLGGTISTLIGVPILVTASSRIKRITGIMDARSVSFIIAPCRFQNSITQNTQPGISLRLNF